jgi:hypothetical protein
MGRLADRLFWTEDKQARNDAYYGRAPYAYRNRFALLRMLGAPIGLGVAVAFTVSVFLGVGAALVGVAFCIGERRLECRAREKARAAEAAARDGESVSSSTLSSA